MDSITIPGRCPVCDDLVPLFTITPVVSGWWRRRVMIVVSSDASDYVMHMWSHGEMGRSGSVL